MACKKLMCHYPCPSSILKLNNSMFHITWCKIAMNEVSKVYHLKLLHIATKLVFNATLYEKFKIKENRISFSLIISYQA